MSDEFCFRSSMSQRLAFNRNELAGAFGDIGTDLPLIIGMIAAAQLDSAAVLIMFGAMQILSGTIYGLPMPVQPLKAVAVIVITQKVAADVLFGGGLAIGAVMLVLSLTGAIVLLGKLIPHVVIRGIQLGLGLQLSLIALREYLPAEGMAGYGLAAIALLIGVLLYANRRWPAALFMIALGIIYALAFTVELSSIAPPQLRLPSVHLPTWDAILQGFLLLALPQIPLSLGNSIYATERIIKDYFPERAVGARKISFTYSIMNLINPWFSGIPVCHGSGGMAGHVTFGARTGGSVVIYGMLYLVVGLFFSHDFDSVFMLFPKPVLAVILLFEGTALMALVKDVAANKLELTLALFTGVIAAGVPYGFLIAMVVGTFLFYSRAALVRNGAKP
jgi:hypothetical protein